MLWSADHSIQIVCRNIHKKLAQFTKSAIMEKSGVRRDESKQQDTPLKIGGDLLCIIKALTTACSVN